MSAKDLAEIFKVLSSDVRVRILLLLEEMVTPIPSTVIAGMLDCEAGNISYHLAKLREAGLIKHDEGGYTLTDTGRRISEVVSLLKTQSSSNKLSVILENGKIARYSIDWLVAGVPGLKVPPSVLSYLLDVVERIKPPIPLPVLMVLLYYALHRKKAFPQASLLPACSFSKQFVERYILLDARQYTFKQKILNELSEYSIAQYALSKLADTQISEYLFNGLICVRKPATLFKGALSLQIRLDKIGNLEERDLLLFLARAKDYVYNIRIYGLSSLYDELSEDVAEKIIRFFDALMPGFGRVEIVLSSPSEYIVLEKASLRYSSVYVSIPSSMQLEDRLVSSILSALKQGNAITFRPDPPVHDLSIVTGHISILLPSIVEEVNNFTALLDEIDEILKATVRFAEEIPLNKSLHHLLKKTFGRNYTRLFKLGVLGSEYAIARLELTEGEIIRLWRNLPQADKNSIEITPLHEGDEPYYAVENILIEHEHPPPTVFNSLSPYSLASVLTDKVIARESELQLRGIITLPTFHVEPSQFTARLLKKSLEQLLWSGLKSFSLTPNVAYCLQCGMVSSYNTIVCPSCTSATVTKFVAPFGYPVPLKSVSTLVIDEYSKRPYLPRV